MADGLGRLSARGVLACALVVISVLLGAPSRARTERFDVHGVVADSAGAGLPGAMVVVLTRADSVLTRFATADGRGAFALRRVPTGEYILQVSHMGYQPLWKDFSVGDTDADVGVITLVARVVEMDALVVSADHIPFVVRRDTLDYNAAAFETRPNATVEDLLDELPGIEVEADGSITAQGEEVKNVLVEGKEFFGSDPTIATRNLPAKAVERVQVYDRQSDMSEFTGIADGQEERTIDLELVEGARSGYFGRLSGGIGTDLDTCATPDLWGNSRSPYDGTLSLNRFSLTTQLAAIANLNSVNRPGFWWGDYQTFAGGGRGMRRDGERGDRSRGVRIGGGRDDGFTETAAAGVNASHDFGEKGWIRSSYFLSSLDNRQDRVLQQQQLLGSAVSSLVDQTSHQVSDQLTHRLNLNAQRTFADGHDLRLRGHLTAGSSSLASFSSRDTRSAAQDMQNAAVTDYATREEHLGGSAGLTWRRRLGGDGRTAVAEARVNLSDADQSGDLSSTGELHGPDGAVTNDRTRQEQSHDGRTLSQSQRLSLTEPLGGGRVLELFGERRTVDEDQTESILDLGRDTRAPSRRPGSRFERTYTYRRGGLRFSRNTAETHLVLGLQVQGSDLDGAVLDRDERVSSSHAHFLPSAHFRIHSKKVRNLDIRYWTSTREPTMAQLQPFVDNRDPLYVRVGNPDLIPEYTHGLSASYRYFDQFSFGHLFTHLKVTSTGDGIVPSRTVDEQGRQVVTSVNADRGWSTNAGVYFGTPVRTIGARLEVSYRGMYSTGSEFVNQTENRSRILRHTVGAGLENHANEDFSLEVGGELTLNTVHYSLSEELNQTYLNSIFRASGSYYLGDDWTLSTGLSYRAFDQEVFGPGQSIAQLEASISRRVLDDHGEIELAGFDLLNQHQGVHFTNASSYIQEERIESLGHYVILRFIYHLKPAVK